MRDTRAGLEWTRRDDGVGRDWHAAEAYCRVLTLGGSGWRLPTIEELRSLRVASARTPCGDVTCGIDPAFAITNPYVWTSTAQGDSARAYIDFQFFRIVLGASRAAAVRDVIVNRVVTWTIVFGIFAVPGSMPWSSSRSRRPRRRSRAALARRPSRSTVASCPPPHAPTRDTVRRRPEDRARRRACGARQRGVGLEAADRAEPAVGGYTGRRRSRRLTAGAHVRVRGILRAGPMMSAVDRAATGEVARIAALRRHPRARGRDDGADRGRARARYGHPGRLRRDAERRLLRLDRADGVPSLHARGARPDARLVVRRRRAGPAVP